MSVTIRDVAKKAGVSPATVSRYFSGSNVVSDEFSKRINKSAKELGYKVKKKNPTRQGVIVVLLPDDQIGFYSEVIKKIIDSIPKYLYRIIFVPITKNDESYKSIIKELNVVGVIYLDEHTKIEVLNYINDKCIPQVMFGGVSPGKKIVSVRINDIAAANEGASYLLSLGHRDILILAGKIKNINSDFQRVSGCKQAFAQYNVPEKRMIVKEIGTPSFENAYHAIKKYILKHKIPDAIFAFSDESAVGTIKALEEADIRVPEEISVLGFDGISISGQMAKGLTTIQQPLDKMIEATMNYFIYEIGRQYKDEMDYVFPYTLLKRDTCLAK